MAERAKYEVRGFVQPDPKHGYDSGQQADTLTEARRIAKYWMTPEYMNVVESVQMIRLVQIWKGEELVEEKYA